MIYLNIIDGTDHYCIDFKKYVNKFYHEEKIEKLSFHGLNLTHFAFNPLNRTGYVNVITVQKNDNKVTKSIKKFINKLNIYDLRIGMNNFYLDTFFGLTNHYFCEHFDIKDPYYYILKKYNFYYFININNWLSYKMYKKNVLECPIEINIKNATKILSEYININKNDIFTSNIIDINDVKFDVEINISDDNKQTNRTNFNNINILFMFDIIIKPVCENSTIRLVPVPPNSSSTNQLSIKKKYYNILRNMLENYIFDN